MGDYDIGHVCPYGKVAVVEQGNCLGELVDKFAGYEYAFAGTDGLGGEELRAVLLYGFLIGEAGIDFLGRFCADAQIAEFQIIHVWFLFVLELFTFLIEALQDGAHILEMLFKYVMDVLGYG